MSTVKGPLIRLILTLAHTKTGFFAFVLPDIECNSGSQKRFRALGLGAPLGVTLRTMLPYSFTSPREP